MKIKEIISEGFFDIFKKKDYILSPEQEAEKEAILKRMQQMQSYDNYDDDNDDYDNDNDDHYDNDDDYTTTHTSNDNDWENKYNQQREIDNQRYKEKRQADLNNQYEIDYQQRLANWEKTVQDLKNKQEKALRGEPSPASWLYPNFPTKPTRRY